MMRGYAFRPGRVPTLVTLLLLPLLLGLGYWQWQRAAEKEALLAAFQTRQALPAVELAVLPDPAAADNRYRRVMVRGHYDSAHQILLDNQPDAGRPGLHVYTPLRLDGRTEALLINRGWLPWGSSRAELPDIALAQREVTVIGWLGQPANPALRLGSAEGQGGWPRLLGYLDYGALARQLGYPLLPVVLLLDPQVEQGYRRDWQPQFGGLGPERHRGYALQWFALAAALLIIYLAVNLRRRERT
ncbi:MAG TPA: SURF1 family protein [Candidatus Competibacteraceae bacterium]|nr:SURF1 family protein [Candidatus Competibacteraceae bacterium]